MDFAAICGIRFLTPFRTAAIPGLEAIFRTWAAGTIFWIPTMLGVYRLSTPSQSGMGMHISLPIGGKNNWVYPQFKGSYRTDASRTQGNEGSCLASEYQPF